MHPTPSPGPPEEGVDVTVSDHGCEPKLGQEHVPNLTAEDTTQQDMIQSLGGLKTHDASVIVLQPMPHPPIRGPAMTTQSQLEEEPDLGRCVRPPNQLGTKWRGRSDEHRTIRRRRRVLVVSGPTPDDGVRNPRHQLYLAHPLPEVQVLEEDLNSLRPG